MKQIVKIIIVYTLFACACLGIFFFTHKEQTYKGRDLTKYNDQLYNIYSEYNKGVNIPQIEEKYHCKIIMTKELVEARISKYYENSSLVLDFSPNGNYMGKIVWDDKTDDYLRFRDKILYDSFIFWAMVFVLGYILIIVYYLAIVAPIKEIDRYAEEIAKGKLDLQLPMRRTNLFERFTESFDMMRESLKQAKKEEMAANAAKAELVSELSHDIKTPIATIEATCEVMQMQYQNKLAKLEEENGDKEEIDEVKAGLEKLGFIANKSETIIKLVENVLHVNMDEVDELKVEPRELDTIEIEKLIKNTTGYGNIILKNHIRRCLVYADKLRLEQAIDNVINNSYKYAGTDIMVEFAESSEVIDGRDRGFIKIIISDRGPGVSDREMPLLTEKYYRGKNKGEKDGYGLGLYLVKLYMEKQGGGMEYYNSDGFVVELILRKV